MVHILISHFLWKNVGCWKKSTISNSKVMNTKFGQRLSLMVTSSSPTTNNGQYSLSAIFEQHKQNPQMPHFWHDQIFPDFWKLVRRMENIWRNFDYERFSNNPKGKKRSIFIFDISNSNHKICCQWAKIPHFKQKLLFNKVAKDGWYLPKNDKTYTNLAPAKE